MDPLLNLNKAKYAPTEFRNFPELPTELRLKIWVLALPPLESERLIRVSAHPVVCDADVRLDYNFTVNKDLTMPHATTSPSIFQTSLLCACKESRQVCLETFKLTCSLPCGTEGGQILFSDDTIIYVENMEFVFGDQVIKAFTNKYRVPKWFQEIKRLALPANHFDSDGMMLHFGPIGKMIGYFGGLRELYLVIGDSRDWYPWMEMWEVREFFKLAICRVVEVLEHHKKNFDGDYCIPEIKLMKDGLGDAQVVDEPSRVVYMA